MGEFQHAAGNSQVAKEHFQVALEGATQLKNRRMMAYALTHLGNVAHIQAQYAEAIDYNQRSLDLFRDVGDRSGMADAHLRLADALRYLDRNDEAEGELEAALKLYEAVGDVRGVGNVAMLLARLAQAQGDFTIAESYQRRALDARRATKIQADVVDSLLNLILLHGSQLNINAAAEYIAEAEAILAEIGDDHPVLVTRLGSIKVYVQLVQGQYEQPYAQLPAMADSEQSMREPLWKIYMLSYWGTACWGLGKLDEAATRYYAAVQVALDNHLSSHNYVSNMGLAVLLSRLLGEHQSAFTFVTYLMREWKQLEFHPLVQPLIRLEDIQAQLTPEQRAQAEADSYTLDRETVMQALLDAFSGGE
jgi:tetratricopeptide (TPR) repeat protein